MVFVGAGGAAVVGVVGEVAGEGLGVGVGVEGSGAGVAAEGSGAVVGSDWLWQNSGVLWRNWSRVLGAGLACGYTAHEHWPNRLLLL